MLIAFIGAPCSGKTTTAALVFADLKDAGQAVEFIPEQARLYIAETRVVQDIFPPKTISLNDKDQNIIALRQLGMEKLLLQACQGSLIVTDSSPLNSLLYMSEEFRNSPKIQEMVVEYLRQEPLIFYSPPVSEPSAFDPGRVHNRSQSQSLDDSIDKIISPYLKASPPVSLHGNSRQRATQALAAIWTRISGGPNRWP